jgi:hypothetical protein
MSAVTSRLDGGACSPKRRPRSTAKSLKPLVIDEIPIVLRGVAVGAGVGTGPEKYFA